MGPSLPALPGSASGSLGLALVLVVLWIIVSVPVYFAGKAVTRGKADFGDAMGATLGGALAYYVVYYVIEFLLRSILGQVALGMATLLGLIAWLGAYRLFFRTRWSLALAIVMLAWLILFVLNLLLTGISGITFPAFFPF